MDPGEADSPVTLVIKAPNQKYEDQTINCFLNWTVERLKRHLSNVYPSRPVTILLDSGLILMCDVDIKLSFRIVFYVRNKIPDKQQYNLLREDLSPKQRWFLLFSPAGF